MQFDVSLAQHSCAEKGDKLTRPLYFVDDALEIGGEARANSTFLGWGIDTDEDQISLIDSTVDFCCKEQILPPRGTDDVLEAWLIDRQPKIGAVPCIDTCLVQVNNRDLDMRAFQCYHGTSRST